MAVNPDKAFYGYRAVVRHQNEKPGDPNDVRQLAYDTIVDILHYAVNEGAVSPEDVSQFISTAATQAQMEVQS